MGPYLEMNGKAEASQEVLVSKETSPAPAFSEQKVAQPGTNGKVNDHGVEVLPIEQVPLSGGNEDIEVNITGCVNSGKAVEDACEDLTECSSSFGDTGSGIETGSAFSDTEVESRMCAGNSSSPVCDEWSKPLPIRKKKMTIHWRRFIQPFMWRCKWLELQLKKLHSQALKYDKELAAYNHKKQLEFSKFTLDGVDVKSVPRSDGIPKNQVMKRKKRKRAEKCDLSSYVSNHTIFSYYENKGLTDGACLEDFPGVAIRGNVDNNEEFKLNDVWSSVDNEDNDKSLADIIQKIEAVQSQVQKLKTRIDKVVNENPGKFRSVTQLSTVGPSDGLNHSDHNSGSFAGNESKLPVGFVHASSQLKSEMYNEDLLIGNTLPTCEGITPLTETTIRHQLEVPLENAKDEVLIQNQAVKEELSDLENVRNQIVENANEPVKEQKSISLAQVSEPGLSNENAVQNAQSALKVCSTSKSNLPRNTRRRRQKSGAKSWRRRQFC